MFDAVVRSWQNANRAGESCGRIAARSTLAPHGIARQYRAPRCGRIWADHEFAIGRARDRPAANAGCSHECHNAVNAVLENVGSIPQIRYRAALGAPIRDLMLGLNRLFLVGGVYTHYDSLAQIPVTVISTAGSVRALRTLDTPVVGDVRRSSVRTIGNSHIRWQSTYARRANVHEG